MSTVARARVSDRPFARTVYGLALRRFSGELRMERPDGPYRVFWHAGAVSWAFSPAPEDTLPQVAAAARLLDATAAAAWSLDPPGSAAAEVVQLAELARRAALDPDRSAALARHLLAQRAARIFGFADGEFSLEEPEAGSGDTGVPRLDPRQLIYLGVRTYYDRERLAREMARVQGARFRLSPDARGSLRAFGFAAAELAYLRVLDQQSVDLNELARAAQGLDDRRLLALVYTLVACDCLDVVDAGGAADAGTGAAAPAGTLRGPAHLPPGQTTAAALAPSQPRAAGGTAAPAQAAARGPTPAAGHPATVRGGVAAAGQGAAAPGPAAGHPAAVRGGVATGQGAAAPGPAASHPATVRGVVAAGQSAAAPGPAASHPATVRGVVAAGQGAAPGPAIPGRPAASPAPLRAAPGEIPDANAGVQGTLRGAAPLPSGAAPDAARGAAAPRPAGSAPAVPTSSATPDRGAGDAGARRRGAATSGAPDGSAGVTGGGDPAAEIRALVKQRNELIRDDADHYQILGVARDASEAQLRSAYFALARRLHPDRLAALDIRDMDEQAQQVFARINAAFSILGATDRRAAYDAELGRGGARVAAAEQAEAEKLAARIFGAEEAYHQGEVALRRQNHAAAVEHFRRAAELNPQEGEYHALLAWAVWCHASDQAAVTAEVRRMMNKAIALAPNNATVYFYRGMLARQLGQEETAEQCFRKVLELRPDHPEAGLELRLLEARRKTADKQGGLFGRLTRR